MQTGRGGYRGKSKPKLLPHLKRVHINPRIQQWMVDQLKKKGEIGFVLEDIIIKAGFEYSGLLSMVQLALPQNINTLLSSFV